MKFIHVYNDKYFKGLEVNGLINEESGFKIQHSFPMEADMKFNRYAAKGTKLYNFIRENHFPFYVDRLTGGITYHKYNFDRELIHEYENMLGDWFLGIQLHETGGNRRLDWQRVMERMDGSKGPYDAAVLRSRSVRDYAVTAEGEVLCGFSQGSPEEYASFLYPETVEAFNEDIRNLFIRRQGETDGFILPCDSFQLFTKMQDEVGMRHFMPEVGCQIPDMRIQVALARGMALAKNKKWGTYYECWRRVPDVGYSMPCYNSEPGNEWYLTQETHKDDFTTHGENGGSSRLLQRRIYYYSLMSGAQFFAEEWGLNCSYTDMSTTFALSAYGEVKKEFINFSLGYRNIKAKVPFAIVLPCDMPCVHIGPQRQIGMWPDSYSGRPLSDAQKKHYGYIEDVIALLFRRNPDSAVGNEGHVMQNSRFGDLFDIIYEDEKDEVLARYDTLIDPTWEGNFAKAKGDRFRILQNTGDLEKLARELEARALEILPVRVDSLHWMLSEDEKGNYLTVFNNEGNERSLEFGDTVLPEADARAKICLKEPGELKLVKATSSKVKLERVDANTYYLDLPGTEFAILQY